MNKTDTGPGGAIETLVILAPLDGWAAPLAEVPDPVFADRMMGDGLAIDPTASLLSAPCDGEVMLMHAARHAVTLRAANGAEILMHVGLDTVALGGNGFTAHVRQGQKARAGEALISFDLEILGQAAKSLITPLVIANGDDFAIEWRLENQSVKRGQEIMRVRRLAKMPAAAVAENRELRRDLVMALAHGLHARPAARLADLAKSYSADMVMEFGARRASLRSPVAMMGLGVTEGASVNLIATGADAGPAIAAITALLESGMGEVSAAAETIVAVATVPDEPGVLTGVRASAGLALGRALRFAHAEIAVMEEGRGPDLEDKRLDDAIASVRTRLNKAIGKDRSAIMAAHLAFLDDPELAAEARRHIARGKSAGHAWRSAIGTQVAVLGSLKETRFAERAADLVDLERQVLTALGDVQAPADIALPENTLLLADDLLPSEFVALDASRLAGIALGKGGPTSHVAILAGALNIPMLVACGPRLLSIRDDTPLLLDADHGRLTIDPGSAMADAASREIAARRTAHDGARAAAHHLCHTKDGVRIEVNANLGSQEEAGIAVEAGAEGCGLLRTEFLFLDRESPPDETEQAETYRAIAKALEGRPLTVRTLDIGGDKPAPYLPFPAEENPALGLRGVRVSLWRPDLLAVQLRAILQAVPASQCRIMVPMIASLAELRKVRRALDRARAELGVEETILLGVMVETPAAAMTADLLAAEADFLSIGTNDLTQYCLAMDRGSALLAPEFDALHPAVLRLIKATTDGAVRYNRPVGVCGGLASDIAAAPILIGLGVRSLSSATAQIPALKARINTLSLDQCRRLAEEALAASSAAEVRALALSMGET